MKRTRLLVVSAVAALATSAPAMADTNAPSAQTFVLNCGGTTITFVSPTFAARAAQIVGTTGTAILVRVVDSAGNVLFEQPSFKALRPSALTTCTLDGIAFIVLVTPQSG